MRILFDSYNLCRQNRAGGVQNKIMDLYNCLHSKSSLEVDLFDKWNKRIEDYDIIHFFKVSSEYWSELNYAKAKGKKIILSSIIPLDNKVKIKVDQFLCKLFHIHTANYFTRCMFELVDVIITETIKEKEFIIKTFDIVPSKIEVIPNGIKMDFDNVEKSLFCNKFDIHPNYVIQVGRIDRNKNLLSVIRALKGTGIELVVIGGPATNEMSYYEQCRKEADETVHFVGWINHDDPLLASALLGAKVLVLPSHKEIFGNAVFEGAMAGANIVLTNELPYKDWGMEDSFYPINPNSIDDIRNKLIKAYNSPVDRDVANKIKQGFSIEAIAERHISLYERISG